MTISSFLQSTFAFITLFTVRLVDGPTIYEGRVEVQHNGAWDTVCDYEWDLNDAQVVCHQLGFGNAVAAIRNSSYGQGISQDWVAYLDCVGNEETIESCSYKRRRYYDYYYYDYYCSLAGARCSSGNLGFIL